MSVYGIDTFVRIFSHLAFIYFAFWSLQSLRLDVIFKKGVQYDKQIRIFYALVAIAVGYNVSNFFLEIIFLIRNYAEGLVI